MSRTHFFIAVRDDRETEIEVEFSATSGEDASYSYGGRGTAFDTSGCGPEVEIIDAWLLADTHLAKAPSITLTDAECERIEVEILESPDAIPDDDCPDYDW